MHATEHLFREEAARMVVALVRLFGVHNLGLAEDVVQEALCLALEVWKFEGPPDEPRAWLWATAKRAAIDALRRERTARKFAPEVGFLLDSEWTLRPAVDERLTPAGLEDDTLRMMFTCCAPRLPEEVQAALVLNICCGFGAREIAAAFLSGEAAIEKRLSRGKRALAQSRELFALDGAAVAERLESVHRALYLLFNEGYHGAGEDSAVQAVLCTEALRLALLLASHPVASTPATRALAALFCFQLARLSTRTDDAEGGSGRLVPLARQDRTKWDRGWIDRGTDLLTAAAAGNDVTVYHLEAAIAAQHARAPSFEDTPWDTIVTLYGHLYTLRPTPVVALHRALALAELEGPERGLAAIDAIEGRERLARHPVYEAALGELRWRSGSADVARAHFTAASRLARSPMERRFFEQRAAECRRTERAEAR